MGHLLTQRIKESARREANIILEMDWEAIKKALKKKYGESNGPSVGMCGKVIFIINIK